jgi:hypothetical protein
MSLGPGAVGEHPRLRTGFAASGDPGWQAYDHDCAITQV